MWKTFKGFFAFTTLLSLLALCPISVKGQGNIGMTAIAPHSSQATRLFPSGFLTQDYQVEIGYHFWMGNTNISYAAMRDFYNSQKLTSSEVDQLVDGLGRKNSFAIGQNYQVAGSWRDQNGITWSVGIKDDLAMNLQYSRQFAELLWKGNAPFAGETIELTPLRVNSLYLRSFTVGAAIPLGSDYRKQGWRVGGRLRYIQGLAGVRMNRGKITMYTEPDGRYIDFDFDYQMHEAGFQNFNWFQPNGHGAGLSLGASRYLNDDLALRMGINNLGFVTFNRETRKYSKNRKVRYEGLIISNLFGSDPDLEGVDSLSNIFLPEEGSGSNFTAPLNANIALQTRYSFDGLFPVRESLWATYVMGINEMPGFSKIPIVNLVYRVSNDRWGVAPSVGMGGYQKWQAGLCGSYLFFDHLRVRMNMDNFLPFLIPKNSYGIEASFQVAYEFGGGSEG